MNTLTTRQIVFGLLMGFVLVFGVQGIVNAQSVSVSGDGSTTSSSRGTTVITDYRATPEVERSFTISVSNAKNAQTVTIDPTGATITEVRVTSAPSPQTKFDDGDNPDSDTPTGTDQQIVPAKGVLAGNPTTITFNGLGKPDSATATGSWQIKVTYTVGAFGNYSIAIGGTADSDPSGSPIAAYVVRSDSLARNLSFNSDSTDTPVVRTSSVTFDVGTDQWFRVDLRITGGKLYLDSGQYLSGNRLFDVTQRKEFTSLSMFTASDGSVTANLIQNNGQVAKITATIPGSNARGKTYTVTSFDSATTIEQVSGNHQFGYTNSGTNYGSWMKLRNPLVVRVVDGHGTNKGVSGQWVTFTATGAARFRAVSRANLWDSSGDGSISAADDNQTPLTVKTDSSGRAQVYLLPGDSPATYTVTYAVRPQDSPTALTTALTGSAASSPSQGAINEQFTATAIRDTGTTRGYIISRVSGEGTTSTPQILRGGQRDTQLTVHADDGNGADATNVQVDFSVSGGRITLTSGSNYQTSLSTVTGTDSNARVWVQASGNSVAIVTARIVGSNEDAGRYVVTFLRNGPYIEIVSGDDQDGAIGGRLEDPLVVRVLDGRGGSSIPNQIVKFAVTADDDSDHANNRRQFIPVPGTYVFVTETATDIFDQETGNTPANGSIPREANALRPNRGSGTGQNIFVQTDSDGQAQVYLRLGSADDPGTTAIEDYSTGDSAALIHRVTATTPNGAPSAGVRFRADAVDDARQAKLEIVSGDGQSAAKGDPLENPLVVRVRTVRGFLLQGTLLEFTAPDGTLLKDPDHDTTLVSERGGGNEIRVRTGSDGQARVDYNVGQLRIAREVSVEVVEEQGGLEYDFTIDEVRFGVNGGQGTGEPTGTPQLPAAPRNVISISPATITDAPDEEVTLSVTSDPSGRFVTLSSADFADSLFLPASGTTPFQSTLTLPDADGEYAISATSAGLTSGRATVIVETGILGRITITAIGAPSNGTQNFSISVRDTDGDRISSALTVTVSGAGFTTRSVRTANGSGVVDLTLPTTAGTYTLTASATDDYTSGTTQVRIAETTTDEQPRDDSQPTTTRGSAGVADSVQASGQVFRTGTVNTQLDLPLSVRVLDGNDTGVANVRVTFRVRTGQGRLSQRGNGRAIQVETDRSGYARAPYTPLAQGSSTVRANAAGITQTVTFTITANGASETGTDPGIGEPAETPSREISPEVRIGAASRPPMVWIDGGGIYALVGANVERFAPRVDNALNIAVSGSKVYWTEKTGESSGTINSANLDGSGVTELASILAVPMGIAVGDGSGKLYWTNSRGRIQSANLDGSKITNVLQNLPSPKDITIARGNLYWTQYDAIEGAGSVGITNPAGRGSPKYIATGADMPGSLVVAGNKVYWTEMTGTHSGTINSANLNGNGATQLASILAAPMGIGVDGLRSKLYWSNSRGRIQSANLDGSKIQNAVTGLGMPGDMVLSSSLKAPAAATPTEKEATPTASKSKYDVNGDGTVDGKDSDALIVAVAAGVTDAKYDVNGDGKVDINDVVAVTANRSGGAAGAPTLLGMKLNALEVNRLQEQIDLLIAINDRSPAAMRTLVYLQQLIVMARPSQTQLLANYPNPFNPETWMPYELATDTDVRITIYNAQGVVIRTLQLGQQSAGYYTDRERAAYWDGRNAFGEQVASGVYFYQLETDTMSALRKMVILK